MRFSPTKKVKDKQTPTWKYIVNVTGSLKMHSHKYTHFRYWNMQIKLDHEEEVPYLPMNEDQFSQAKQSMNAGRKEIFTLLTQSIQNQMSGAEERLRIFFTGGAGVGKTFLLKLLRDQINRCYAKDAVKICSLTGVAARLINGATIHSTLKLPVQKDGRITDTSDEFAIDKALRVYPTNQQVNDHNSAVLNLYRNNGARITQSYT
ncbi:hypothetical protein HW555_013931 [Spodoptera exigua]|uniref:ATP-dependent DNA helicase n=1 Tax=Spodoptera exigua TaxID=7107 RepID=A0A835G2G5_SPOEX|nr:hypothetical protein HW555_013931 [Spodoptera exigua]